MKSQNSFKRRTVYHGLLETVRTLDDADMTNSETIVKTGDVIEKTRRVMQDGTLEDRVEHPVEGLLDSRVLLASSHLTTKLTDSFSGNVNVYDADELAEHIKTSPQFWLNIKFPKRIDDLRYKLLGPCPLDPPEKGPARQRKHVERQKQHATREPENITSSEQTKEASESVQKIHKFISKYFKTNGMKPISYFELVLNPNSFERTIENIYHASFLVRDGLISILIDENSKLPVIAPVSKQERERLKAGQEENNQFIVSLDMNDWQNAINAFQITKPLMNI